MGDVTLAKCIIMKRMLVKVKLMLCGLLGNFNDSKVPALSSAHQAELKHCPLCPLSLVTVAVQCPPNASNRIECSLNLEICIISH